jgi:hypothetical protein
MMYLLYLCAHIGFEFVFHLCFCKVSVCHHDTVRYVNCCLVQFIELWTILYPAKSNLFVYKLQQTTRGICSFIAENSLLSAQLLYKTEIIVLTPD